MVNISPLLVLYYVGKHWDCLRLSRVSRLFLEILLLLLEGTQFMVLDSSEGLRSLLCPDGNFILEAGMDPFINGQVLFHLKLRTLDM